MDCQNCKNMLHDLLDGELTSQQAIDVRKHIESCPDCHAEYERLRKMQALLTDLRDVEVPEGHREQFVDALRDRIEAEERRGTGRIRFNWRPVLIGAILVVVVLILVVGTGPQRHPVPEIDPAPGLTGIENAAIDRFVVGVLDDHIIATSGDFMVDPSVTGGEVVAAWKIFKETHSELFEPAE